MPFPIPTTIRPEKTICVTIQIPDEPTYRQVFIGQVHALTRWFNHDRDENQSAKKVGERWMESFITLQIEECDSMPCCPEETHVNYQIYQQQQRNAQTEQRLIDDGDTAASFNAPATFNGDGSDARENSLCRTVNRMVAQASHDQAMALGAGANLIGRIISSLPLVHPIEAIVGHALDNLTLAHLQDLLDDCAAVRDVSCCMRDYLRGKDTTIANVQAALGGCGFSFGSHQAELAAMVNQYIQQEGNARAFIAAMDADYQQVGMSGGATAADCDCDCPCNNDFSPVDWMGTGCSYEYMGDCVWHITQNTPYTTIAGVDWYQASIQDLADRCWNYSEATPYGNEAVSNHKIWLCCPTGYNETVGGWDGNVEKAWWNRGAAPISKYYKITPVNPELCV